MWFRVLLQVLLWLLCLAVAIYLALKHHYGFWLRNGVPQIRPIFVFGNFRDLLRMVKSPAVFFQELYHHPDALGHPLVGIHMFYKPAIYVRDPELIKRIMIKDFSKFSNRYSNSDNKDDVIGSQNLFFLKNPDWKEVRSKLSPFFTSCKMRQMFSLIEEVGRTLDAHLLSRSVENENLQSFCLELKEFCALYTTDVIATVAYGVQANSFKKPNGDFRRNGRMVFRFTTKRAVEFVFVFFLPHLVSLFGLKVVPQEATNFLRSTINYVMQKRELSGEARNDLIDILIEYKKWSKTHRKDNELVFEGDILVAQAALFFTAGFETSSATMSFALYELAKHPDIQQRLREEIRAALIEHDGNINQRMIDSLEYLQMVINEVLRLYPPLPFLDRECTVDKGTRYSLEPFSDYSIPNGMPVLVPVFAIHRDPQFYPNPEIFDPERFSPLNKRNILPNTYMPFGLGPHGCIGERLAMMQTKIGLVHLLRNHHVETCQKTQQRMKLDPKSIVVQAEGGIYLNVVRDPLNV